MAIVKLFWFKIDMLRAVSGWKLKVLLQVWF